MNSANFVRRAVGAALVVGVFAGLWYWLATRVPSNSLENTQPGANSKQPPTGLTKKENSKTIEPDLVDMAHGVKTDDPRLTYDSIYRNIRPNVKFMGDDNCAQCHDEICETYHAHPMGRSAIRPGADSMEKFDEKSRGVFRFGAYELRSQMEDGRLVHQLTATMRDGTEFAAKKIPVDLTIGSGTRGRSYVIVDGEHVWQSPISWYSTKSHWDVSPGFDLGLATQRATVSTCLFCHVNEHEPIAGTDNSYRKPFSQPQLQLGCERCHGPGELHSMERTAKLPLDSKHSGIDTSIVNPAHLSDSLQMSICAQCHLRGKTRVVRRGRDELEYRPGMPFELFENAFVAPPESEFNNKAVGHFDQLEQSKCRTASGGRLLCTSCHDAHEKPAPAVLHQAYLDQCIACHQQQTCSAPQALRQKENDNCIHCHMPVSGSADIAHTSLTDHRILRDPSRAGTSRTAWENGSPLKVFSEIGLPESELERDLGIALVAYAEKLPADAAQTTRSLQMARFKLQDSIRRWPDDIAAGLALSRAEVLLANPTTALESIEAALKQSPKNELLLQQLAIAADRAGKPELAQQAFTQLIQISPHNEDYRLKRIAGYFGGGDLMKAEAACRSFLNDNPLQPTARMILGLCLVASGNKDEGDREIDNAMTLATTPQQRAFIRSQYDRFLARINESK